MANKVGLDVIMLIRGAIDSKIECWKNLSAAEKALGGSGIEVSEDALEDLVVGIGSGSSAQLTNKEILDWLVSVTKMEAV